MAGLKVQRSIKRKQIKGFSLRENKLLVGFAIKGAAIVPLFVVLS
jgi:hypothetical protein